MESAYAEAHAKPFAAGGWLPHRVEFAKTPETAIFLRKGEKKTNRQSEETTDRIYPGELLAVERIYDFPADGAVVQVGLQVKLRKRWPIRPIWGGGIRRSEDGGGSFPSISRRRRASSRSRLLSRPIPTRFLTPLEKARRPPRRWPLGRAPGEQRLGS